MNVLEITVVTSIQHVPISLVRIIVVVTLDSLEMELTAQVHTAYHLIIILSFHIVLINISYT